MRLRLPLLVVAAALALPAAAGADELLGVCGSDLCVSGGTGTVTPVTSDGAANPYTSPSVSLDGRVTTFVRADGLYRGGIHGADAERLFDTDRGRESAVSQDGGSFAFRTFDSAGGTLSSTLRIGGASGSALWSNDSGVNTAGYLGGGLLITEPGDTGHDVACAVPVVPEGPPPCASPGAIDPSRDVARPTGTPHGGYVAAQAETRTDTGATVSSVIALYGGSGAPVRDLTTGPADTAPAFSPDGTQVAFTRGTDTWVIPVAGGEARLLAAGMTQATWSETPGASPVPTGGLPGRPTAPARTLEVRRGRVRIAVRCKAAAGCARTTWTFKQARKTRLTVVVPKLKPGGKRTLSVKVPKATLKRIGRKGLRLRLTGKGLKATTVRLRR